MLFNAFRKWNMKTYNDLNVNQYLKRFGKLKIIWNIFHGKLEKSKNPYDSFLLEFGRNYSFGKRWEWTWFPMPLKIRTKYLLIYKGVKIS